MKRIFARSRYQGSLPSGGSLYRTRRNVLPDREPVREYLEAVSCRAALIWGKERARLS